MATMFSRKLIRISLTHHGRFYSSNDGGGGQGMLSKLVDNLRRGFEKRRGVEGAVGNIKGSSTKQKAQAQGPRARPSVAESESITSKNTAFKTRPVAGVHDNDGTADLKNVGSGEQGFDDKEAEAKGVPAVFSNQRSVSIIDRTKDKSKSKDDPEYEDLGPEEDRHKEWRQSQEKKLNKKAMVPLDFFRDIKDKNKDNFFIAVDIFTDRDVRLRGHVEFIYSALNQMKAFGIHRDLESYKKLIDVFPKGKMIATNRLQVEFMHYPKQQQCAVDLLEQMEEYAVMPDSEVHTMLTNIFGSLSFPMRKVMRMQYWMPKFKNLSPWPLPSPPPDDSLELAKLAIQRITSADMKTKITIFDAADLEDAVDSTWIVSGQSPDQHDLIEKLPSGRPIYVEGAFRVWLAHSCINYFILRAEPQKIPQPTEDPDDVGNLKVLFEEDFIEKEVATVPTVHEQEDGSILAVCATGSSSKDSVVSWIRFLEETNPRLGKDVSVLFTLRSPIGATDDLEVITDIEAKKQMTISDGTIGRGLGLNPSKPDLRNVGVWSQSDSKFVNWPHHPEHRPSKLLLKMRERKIAVEGNDSTTATTDSNSNSSNNSTSVSQSCSSSKSETYKDDSNKT